MEELLIQAEEISFKKLIPLKAHYLLLFGGSSTILPYIFIYAKQLGITADVLGVITASLFFVTVASRLLLAGLADHFQKHKIMLLSMLSISIASGLGLNFIPEPMQIGSNSSTNASVICLQNNSFLIRLNTICAPRFSNCIDDCILSCFLCETNSADCSGTSTLHFALSGNSDRTSTECTEQLISKCSDSGTKKECSVENRAALFSADCGNSTTTQNAPLQLALFSVFTTLFYVSQTTVLFLTDAACFNVLGDKTALYGKQRLWGTVGWGSFSLLAGYLNDLATGSSNIVNYSPGFYLLVVLFASDIGLIWKLDLKQTRKSKNIFKDVGPLLLRPRIMLFILQVIAVGMVRGLFTAYSFWYLESLNANQLLLGLITAMQGFLGELPFLFFSGWIIQKIGHLNVFTVSLVALGVRFLAYAFLVDPWWGLLIETLQGPSFGSFFAAMTSYSKLIAPPGTEATMQGLSQAALEGLGAAAGSLIGGYAVHNFGGRTTFFWTGISSIVFGMVSCIINGTLACDSIRSVKHTQCKQSELQRQT